MFKSVSSVFLIILLCCCLSYGLADSIKRTSVAGFLNYGDETDDDINIVITKSLTAFLSKLPGASITPYEDIEKTALDAQYWKQKKFDAEAAIWMAQKHDAKQLIAGFYKVNKKSKNIEIHVFVYDTVTADLKLQRVYKGPTDIGLFDTIEKMQRSIAGLLYGREFTFGTLSVRITNSQKSYAVYLSGKKTADLAADGHFEEQFVSDEEMELSIRLSDSGKEVFRKRVAVRKDRLTEVAYKPAGTINIKSMDTNVSVTLDGTDFGRVNEDGICEIPDVTACVPHILSVMQGQTELDKKDVTVGEGNTAIIVFDRKILLRREEIKTDGTNNLELSKPSIYYNILLPGIVQMQAGDPLAGYVFLGVDAASIGFSIYSYIVYHDNYLRLVNTTDPAVQESALNACLTWRGLLIGSLAVWAVNTALSVVHAGYLSGSSSIAAENQKPFELIVKTDEVRLEYRFSF